MGLRALEVEVLDSSGKHLATHPRAYGQASTNSEDPSMQLALLCNKPASWPNSRVRDALPDPLREWLDRQDRQTRNEALQTLKRVDRCFASMFVRQVRQCFSAVWADGFPRCRHRFPVM